MDGCRTISVALKVPKSRVVQKFGTSRTLPGWSSKLGGLNGHMVSQFTFNTCANISSLFSFFALLVGGAVCGSLSVKGEFNPFWNKAVTYKNVEKAMRYENNCHL